METKKEIRSRLKKQRSLLGADECHSMSHEIYKRLIALELDREYDNILLYSAIRNEVNTDEYFTYLINKAKRIYYPRVSGDKMSFYRVRSLDELNCGSFNIKEPDMTKEYTQADGRALMIVPGLAFSDTGYRIGYGKGFYDRYLSSFTKRDTVMAVGVGYDFQLLSSMTFEDEYDQFHVVLSNKSKINCKSSKWMVKFFTLKLSNIRRSRHGSVEMNSTSIHKDEGSIHGLT